MAKNNGNGGNGNGRSDWEAIEREYRAGQLSIREVARQFGCSHTAIRKKAKACGWSRDLTRKVRKAVANLLVSREVSSGNEKDIINSAANRGVEVVVLHRGDVKKSQELVSLFQGQLLDAATNRDEIEDAIIDETRGLEGDNKPDIKVRTRMLKAVSLPAHAGVLRDLSVAQKNLIGLERQAYNLTDGDGGGDGEEITAIPIRFLPAPKRKDDKDG